MEYHEAANFLFDLRRFRMKPGTESTARLLGDLGDPHAGPDYVQVAGSNGKGSTARMVESVLRAAGHDVGLYTSPHVDDVRDRIRVNGRPIPEAAVVEFVESVHGYAVDRAADRESPTFFEVLTAMALWHFGREGVDVAVLEVGIGGKHDATSAVDPAAAAVTSVALEHTDVLGDSIAEIARDKAHVAPEGAPLVTGATGEALDAVREEAGDVLVVGEGGDVAVEYGGVEGIESPVEIEGPGWRVQTRLPLPGAHQARNAGVAAALCRQFGAGTDDIASGLRSADWPGRFEVVGRDPLVVLDGAHNPAACAAVADTLGAFDREECYLVFGAMHDKDHVGMVRELPTPDRAFACRPDLDRAGDPDVLARVFEREGIDAEAAGAVDVALDRALSAAGAGDCVLVTGSLYTVGEARDRWTRTAARKRIRDRADARRALEGAHVAPGEVEGVEDGVVHRTVETRARPRQARRLERAALSVGAEFAVSGIDGDEEPVDVVLAGALDQFERLAAGLDGCPALAERIRDSVGLDAPREPAGYPWDDRTAVMGILNVTPDSFHDGGAFAATADATERAREMVAAGADVVDVGGESTRPGADPVPVDEELSRVLPVIERLADIDALVSIDTRKAAVAEAALDAGADIVNDVSGLADPEMRFVAAERDAPLVVMHSIDAPVVAGKEVHYDDVVSDVLDHLRERVLLAERAGLDRSRIVVDPGLGFGKSSAEDFELVARLGEFRALGCPVLVGHSHKSMFGALGYAGGEREHATVGATAMATARGADIVRVHDVAENVAAVRAAEAVTDPYSPR